MPETSMEKTNTPNGLHRRRDTLKIVWHTGAAVVISVFAFLGVVTWVRDEILTPTDVERYRVIKYIPHWSWYWWAILGLATLLVLNFESAHQAIRRLKAELANAKQQLKDEEPKIIFGLLSSAVNWEPLDGPQEYVFALTNYGKRPATYAHIDPITSVRGQLTLYFDDENILLPDGRSRSIAHIVSGKDSVGGYRLNKRKLWEFLHDGSGYETAFNVMVKFEDGQERKESKFKVYFDWNTRELSISPVRG